MRHSTLVPVLVVLLGSSCGEIAKQSASDAPSGATAANGIVYDAADLARAPQLRIGPVPIGESDPRSSEFDLTDVDDVALLSDNRIVTYAGYGAKLLLFDAKAQAPRRLGRQGHGPGEFWSPAGVTRIRGDSLVLLDTGNDRIFWVTPAGVVARSRQIGSDLPPLMRRVAGALLDGRLVVFTSARYSSRSTDTVTRNTVRIGVLPSVGPTSVIAQVDGPPYVVIETRYRGRPGHQPVLPDYSAPPSLIVWDSVVAVAAGGAYQVDLYDGVGRPAGAITVRQQRRPVTQAMRDALLKARIDGLANHIGEPLIDPGETARIARLIPSADSVPSIVALRTSPDGVLWVVEGRLPSDTAWSATGFRHDGSIVGRLTGPLSGSPMAFGRDRVVVLHRDADGVVSLRVHQVLGK